jgi:hypothetical protein
MVLPAGHLIAAICVGDLIGLELRQLLVADPITGPRFYSVDAHPGCAGNGGSALARRTQYLAARPMPVA